MQVYFVLNEISIYIRLQRQIRQVGCLEDIAKITFCNLPENFPMQAGFMGLVLAPVMTCLFDNAVPIGRGFAPLHNHELEVDETA